MEPSKTINPNYGMVILLPGLFHSPVPSTKATLVLFVISITFS